VEIRPEAVVDKADEPESIIKVDSRTHSVVSVPPSLPVRPRRTHELDRERGRHLARPA